MNNLDLAEICGLHAGDGYLRNDGKRIELDISGNIEEEEFYDNHVIPLFSKFFKVRLQGRYFPTRNTYGFVIRDEKIVKFFHELGFPYGKKTLDVEIPEFILTPENLILYGRFIRGLFDTDGTFTLGRRYSNNYTYFKRKYHYYPLIYISTNSIKLCKQVSYLLFKIGINHSTEIYLPRKLNENTNYRISVKGKERIEKWMNLIGSKNPIQLSRYYVWKKFGFCPPYTTFEQRKQMLKNKLNPFSFYGPVA